MHQKKKRKKYVDDEDEENFDEYKEEDFDVSGS